MPKKAAKSVSKPVSTTVNLVAWLTGVLVSLSVGFGMVDGTLNAEIIKIPVIVTQFAGLIVVVLTIISVVLAILARL